MSVNVFVMSKVSNINFEIRKFLSENKDLKFLSKSEILSIMVARGKISHIQASEYLKNSTFDTGFVNGIEVLPQWGGQKESFDVALGVLSGILLSAQSKLVQQDKTDGPIAKTINYFKETFDTDNKKSNTVKLIKQTQKDLAELEMASSPEVFKAKFKELRGVEFSQKNIADCAEKSEIMTKAEIIKSASDSLKQTLLLSTADSASNATGIDANRAVISTLKALGKKDKASIDEVLKDIELKNKDNEVFKKYGGNLRVNKDKNGELQIYRTAKNGYAEPVTLKHLQIISQELELRVNRAYAMALGAEVSENATSKDLEKLADQRYDDIKKDYYESFEKAYGKDNLSESADNYILSQEKNTAYVELGLDFISMASMFVGSGMVLKGARLLGAGTKTVGALTNATSTMAKATPIIATAQITRPVSLIENLGAEEPDWESYGISVKEGAMWVTLGMVSGAIGNNARLFLGQKGLSHIAKNTGKSIDSLIKMYKSGHKLPNNLRTCLSLIENSAKISGTSAEFVADIMMTYCIQKGIRGNDLTVMDYLMSANGAMMGTVMHKTFANISDIEKVKVIQKALLEQNPKMSKDELELASKQLLEIHRLAEEKRNPSVAKSATKKDLSKFDDNVAQLRKNIEEGHLRGLEVVKNLSAQEQKALIEGLKAGADIDDFLMTAVGEKPMCFVDCNKDLDIEKLRIAGFDAIKFNHPYDTLDSMLLINKKMVKNLIEEHTEFYQKRLALSDDASADDIYRALIKDFSRDDIPFKRDLLGVTLGYGKENAMIFALEDFIPDFNFSMRSDLRTYKKALKTALYSENSPFKDFDDAFKAGLAEKIDGIKNIQNPNVPGYHSVDYMKNIYEQTERVDHLRSATKKLETVNDDSIIITRTVKGADGKDKLELNAVGDKKAKETAERIHNFAKKIEKSIVNIMQDAGLGIDKKDMAHRAKSVKSLYDKIRSAICDDGMTFSEAVKSIRDQVGCRTEMADFNYKDYPELVELYKKDPKAAIKKAAEMQSQIYLERVKAVISAQGLDPNNKVSAMRLSNYMGLDGVPYFSKEQVQELVDLGAKYGISLHVKTADPKIRDSGYTALQMNFYTKDGDVFEWQLRGSKVNKFAEFEHVPYDLRTGKDVTGGKAILKNLYAPIEDAVMNMKKDKFDAYNRYLTAHYEHLRLLELGFESKAPIMEDFGITDARLRVESLEILHDLAVKLKDGKIKESDALIQYTNLIK